MELRHQNGGVVCERVTLADTPWRRLKGLLGRNELPAGEGLLIRPTWSVHTAFMRFPIDCVFLTRDLTIQKIAPNLPPFRAASSRGAHAVLELPAGQAQHRGLQIGDKLELSTNSDR